MGKMGEARTSEAEQWTKTNVAGLGGKWREYWVVPYRGSTLSMEKLMGRKGAGKFTLVHRRHLSPLCPEANS